MGLPKDVGQPLLNHRLRLVTDITHNVIWIEGSPILLSVVPMKFQVPDLRTTTGKQLLFSPNFHLQAAIGVEQMVDLINLTDGLTFGAAASAATAESLKNLGIEVKTSSSMLHACVGVDIWSLSGTAGRADDKPFAGRAECAEYSWPLASILNYTSDHIANHFFDLVSYEEIYDRLHRGFGFMQDHGIFVSAACVLEVTHFGDWVPQRSWDRLEFYGFDSSTMYLFGIALARNQAVRYTSDSAAERVEELSANSLTGQEERIHEEALAAARLLDRVQGIQFDLRESRSQLVDQEFQLLLGDALLGRAADQRVQEVRTLVLERLRRRQDTESQVGMARLAFAAAVLAVAAIPGAVETLDTWWLARSWLKISLSVLLMCAALFFTFRALGHRHSAE
jgi:hypothetical protein